MIAHGWCGSIASASTAAVWPLSLVAATFAAGGAADTSGSGSPSCIITTTTGPWQRAPRRTELLPAVRADGSPRRVRAYARASRRNARRADDLTWACPPEWNYSNTIHPDYKQLLLELSRFLALMMANVCRKKFLHVL
eukprot:COSAG02_NODE_307_length_25111_cov_5.306693_11_plen_138_part_00